MTCPNCGAAVAETRRFCGKCGTDLTPEASAAPAVAPPTFDSPPVTNPPAAPAAWGSGRAGAVVPPAEAATAPPAATDPFAPPNLGPPGYAGAPPGYPPPPPSYGAPPPGYGVPSPYPPAGYPGAPPAGWSGYGYGYGPPHTNGLAIASLVLGLVGWMFCGVGSVVAIVLGYVSRGQIKQSWGRQTGSGMATAGIVLGFTGVAFLLVFFILSLLGNSN